MKSYLSNIIFASVFCGIFIFFATLVSAQSTDQNFPTPVKENEISGVIKARDLGDARLTSHYYTFDGGQGDLFVNIQTSNFSGDIDIYVITGLRPLSKIVVYADASEAETGRVLYLRKKETLLLRIQGRTPGDDEATYRIKFAGSFLVSQADDSRLPEEPKVNSETKTNVRVNSVGTIIEVIPKPKPTPKEVEAVAEPKKDEPVDESTEDTKSEKEKIEPSRSETVKTEVVVTDPLADEPKKTGVKLPPKVPARRRSRVSQPTKTSEPKSEPEKSVAKETSAEEIKTPAKRSARAKTPKPPVEETVDPMANIQLVIRFKDGSRIERPMTEVFKFSVERAVLTVISKDGSIGRYKMVDVAGVTIE